MAAIVVPFRGSGGKSRLRRLLPEARARLTLAMLGDVLAAATAVSRTLVVTRDESALAVAQEVGAEVVDDPGGGQGAAVAAALGTLPTDGVVVCNADVPCVRPYDLRTLAASTPPGGIALVPSADGRTNALSLPAPHIFQPLYGARSAERFRAAAGEVGLEALSLSIPNLVDDVDTDEDLRRVGGRAGPRTRAALAGVEVAT